jgi:hypothetical protein
LMLKKFRSYMPVIALILVENLIMDQSNCEQFL